MKLTLARIRLDSGGYDSNGRYYGIGPAVYDVNVDGETVGQVRAKNNFETKMTVTERVRMAIDRHGSRAASRWHE